MCRFTYEEVKRKSLSLLIIFWVCSDILKLIANPSTWWTNFADSATLVFGYVFVNPTRFCFWISAMRTLAFFENLLSFFRKFDQRLFAVRPDNRISFSEPSPVGMSLWRVWFVYWFIIRRHRRHCLHCRHRCCCCCRHRSQSLRSGLWLWSCRSEWLQKRLVVGIRWYPCLWLMPCW